MVLSIRMRLFGSLLVALLVVDPMNAFPVNTSESSDGESTWSSDWSSESTILHELVDMTEMALENRSLEGGRNSSDPSVSEDAMEVILHENEKIPEDMKPFLVEGDILIDMNVVDNRNATSSPHDIHRRNAVRDRTSRWPEGVVPYEIDSVFAYEDRARIFSVFSTFRRQSCVRFVPRKNETDYIHIVSKTGCWSMIGRIGGEQEVSLGHGCMTAEGSIIHELMHVLGFVHEHSRPDRDNFVSIKWENINPNKTENFKKYNQSYLNTLNTSYDYESIMHYNSNAFSTNGQATIEPIQLDAAIGNRDHLSETDLVELKRYYECPSCEDRLRASKCKKLARKGHCESDMGYMLQNCRKSCKICTKCKDKSEYCGLWQESGYCHNATMQHHCPESCGLCDQK